AHGGTGQSSFGAGVIHSDGAALSSSAVSLTADHSRTRPRRGGGTGQTSFSSGVIHSNGSALSSSAVSLSADVSGTLPAPNGSTGPTARRSTTNSLTYTMF